MGLIPEQEHLTVTDIAFEAQRLKTWPGMAHFAGTGPARKTCRGCVFWDNCGEEGRGGDYFSKTGKHGGGLKPRRCGKYASLMQGTPGPAVPHNAAACKYFELNKEPPNIIGKW